MFLLRRFFINVLIACVLGLPLHFLQADTTDKPFLILNNPSDSGMFAVFGSVLGALNHYEKNLDHYSGLKIDLDSGRYVDPERGPNWWEYFFEPLVLGTEGSTKHYFTLEEYLRLAALPGDKRRAYELIQRYVRIKQHILDEACEFFRDHLEGYYVIGIHHRGTDKVLDGPLVGYEKTYTALIKVVKSLSKSTRAKLRIFIATDDQKFLNFMVERLPNFVVYHDFKRSSNDQALHYSPELYRNNYEMGKEALLDCLMLARCNLLIKPKYSCLSNTSICFNPYLGVVELSGD